ncbi:COPII-coated vesicle component Erv41 [Schizosaccharomyces pombe]|uniref:ER-derived vesicles protein 41 n=1 Tax=Schizosaccharomyces pombe (strain 972 / ATCC 24843) TaxID=284812 RepID=ERV41_SCHPO|nr:putative COPII-coated vesicle-associated protein Erv41 [Schizosaccharomyces pombe]O94283.1 RecName: Full=ER-derived vesicles protein 41 [Schizosaccharomyces pombe 972h-]CAA21880.1 COPII-coated vesicle component Erv41 (predicted) [Schizosaccharomyces pombe]|eukprot:NP_596065.1 putative COPII-coated vesicle-associated protein Erv41 [Schizosaccharomyces pombe]
MLRSRVPANIRAFDAFPKFSKEYRRQSSSRGGFFTILLSVLIVVLVFSQCVQYIRGIREQELFIYDSVSELMDLNIDITIAMPCSNLRIDVVDRTKDLVLATEALTLEEAFIKDMPTSSTIYKNDRYAGLRWARTEKFRKKNNAEPGSGTACRIYGQLVVNRVNGQLHITAPGWGYGRSNIPFHSLNFTHYIEELSFGEYYPALVNALDGHYGHANDHPFAFQYYLSVLPTSYKSSFRSFETNQYSLTENSVVRQLGFGSLPPGIFIDYDLEPLAVRVVDKHPNVASTLLRILAISGGLITVASWIERVYSSRAHRSTSEADMLGLLGKSETE